MRFEGDGDVLFASFNQDRTRMCIGTTNGYYIYACNPFSLLYAKEGESTSILEMLFNTSLVAHVGAGDDADSTQRCLKMINTKREKEIIRMNYRGKVRSVCMNRQRLVLLLEDLIYIYDVANMKLVHVISSTPSNPKGICALASCKVRGMDDDTVSHHNFLAYPGKTGSGEVNIYDTVNLRLMNMIEAHDSEVSCLAFNNRGDRLATASIKGTIFRIFTTPKGEKLYELRRGYATYAQISSMCFSDSSNLLAISSDKPTIHVFKLDVAKPAEEPSWTGYFTGGIKAVAEYMPSAVTEIFTQERSFAQASVAEGVSHTAALAEEDGQPIIMAVTSDGYLHKFKIDLVEGGECEEIKKHVVDGSRTVSSGPVEETTDDY